MIGILWDNALEYVVEKESNRYVSIRLEETHETTELEIGNPIDDISYEDLTEFFRWGKSGKENHSGIGLGKLIKYRDKYKFLLIADKRMHQDCTWFFIKIVLNPKPQPANDGFLHIPILPGTDIRRRKTDSSHSNEKPGLQQDRNFRPD